MLSLKFIRDNLESVKKATSNKGYKVDFGKILRLDEERLALGKKVDALRQARNVAAAAREIERGKATKLELDKLEPSLKKLSEELNALLYMVPNPALPDVKIGADERENEVLREYPPKSASKLKSPLDHVELGLRLDILDLERSAKVAGSRFYFLKNEAVLLELALVRWVLELLGEEGFTPMLPPLLVKHETLLGGGYLPYGEDEIYGTQDGLYLAGTAEQPLLAYHANEVLKHLPMRYAGFSTCFRREAGSYGKDVRGIIRTHQFDKVEMFSFTKPEDSEREHEFLLAMAEKIVGALKLPYRVVKMCTGDLGVPAARKYDIETWMPSEGLYRETHSISTTTDFQARRLNIRYVDKQGKLDFVHTLNGTAVAVGRMLVAILENYQASDGSVAVPKVLQKYTGFDKIEAKQ